MVPLKYDKKFGLQVLICHRCMLFFFTLEDKSFNQLFSEAAKAKSVMSISFSGNDL